MFSTWGNNQQQNQQPQQPNAFGQPSAFGSTTNNAFGTTSAFGQPQQQAQQQQQQPQVNPMFGNLTTTPSTTSNTGGFGAFSNNNASNTGGTFGVKPATGFGAFGGGTSAFGGGTTSAFGQPAANPAPATSVFGQPAPAATTSTFGGGNALFGGNKFGTTSNTVVGGATHPVVTTGTANPPYTAATEKDNNTTLQFQSITCMPQYIGYSFDELRVQDYQQGRKNPTNTGAFGQTAFGAAQPATAGLFGAQPTQQPTASLFGGATNTSTTNTGFGTFGQNNAQAATTNTNPLFGGTGAFGQTQPQQQQQQPSAFGATGTFGQPQQQTSIFGGGNTGTSAFGTTANKPAFTPFGGGGGTNAFATGTSAFANPQQQQPAQTPSLFGNTQPAANNGSAFGAFGNTATKPSIFGTATTTTQPTTTAFGTFGNTQQQQAQPQQNQQPSIFGGGLIGGQQQQQQQNQQQQGTQPSIFGGGQTTAPSLFANTNTNTGTGLFGNTQQNQQQPQQQQQQQQQGNIFGGLFNKPPQPAAPLFGTSQANAAQPQQGSLFANSFGQSTQNNPLFGGNKTTAPLLGGSLSGSQGVSTGLFGASANVPGAQGTLTASITQPISENLPIFSMLPPGPRLVDLEQNSPKKKAFFLDMPTRSPVARVLGFTPANSKLRGFGSSSSLTSSTGGVTASMSFTSGKPGALTLNKPDAMSSSVAPDFLGRSGSPALGSGGRHSVKKVILEKKIEPTELFVKSGSPGGLRTGKVTFSPALIQASREKETAVTSAPQVQDSPTPVSRAQPQKSPNRFTATKEVPTVSEAQEGSSAELGFGDYFVTPDLATLKKAGYDQLSAFKDLVVGRKGYGQIQFLEPVDLTGLSKLGALLGEVIRFDDKECSVYPDSEDVDKPPPGSGLNVKAKISLERCWAVDKATREPITDTTHPASNKHLKRLKNMKDTHFESFDIKTGTWAFTVDHF